jgi:hypothetical protein
MKSFKNSQDALLYLMTNRFTHHLMDEYGNSFYHGKSNTIEIERWGDNGEGIWECYDTENISYEDFIKNYDGVELFVTKNI